MGMFDDIFGTGMDEMEGAADETVDGNVAAQVRSFALYS